jgi:sterol desaturase/sphingolipid hydroxylase (fatty acid hydroxylase superfamily)
LHICYNTNAFSQYKIQKGMPPAALITHAFWENLKSDFIAFPLMAWPLYKLLTVGGNAKGKLEIKEKEAIDEVKEKELSDEVKEGWSSLYFGKAVPAFSTMAWQVFAAYLCYDCMFYFSHRALHSKSLYVKYHKQHHQFTTSIGMASSHQHPVEGAIQLLNWYIPLGIVGWLNSGIHISTVFAYNILRWIETVDAHCGYNFPFSPFSFIPFFGGALAHDFHHSGQGLKMTKLADGTIFADFGNYGATVIWDTLLGTFSKEYGHFLKALRSK